MKKAAFDPGLTQTFTGPLRRAINKDGSFNVHRRGSTWRDVNPYLHLINMPWPGFLATIFGAYLAVNTFFATVFYLLGPDQLHGADLSSPAARFLSAFFFSAQTLTTVGYGIIAPHGWMAQAISALEALIGLLGFAIATGLLFGRFSRPSARLAFSPAMVVAPYQDGTSLQFRIVNKRANTLMELEAQMLFMTVEESEGRLKRNYKVLDLERRNVLFFPVTWTVVHPIDASSPLYGKTAEDLEQLQAEALILVKGFDDTFSQTVHARYSYRFDEIVWNSRFAPAFHVNEAGDIVVDIDRVGELVRPDGSPRPAIQ